MATKRILGLFSLVIFCLLSACSSSEPTPQLTKLPSGAKILAFGDSLTFGTGVSEEHSYPSVLQSLIGKTVVRSGIPGEVSAAGLKRLPEEIREHRPDLLVLLHGGNDILRRQSANASYNNLRQMVQLARQEGVSVVLIGVPGFSLSLSGPEAASQYPKVAKELRVPYEGEILASLLSETRYKSDAVHLNREGYRLLAEAIADLLKEAGAL